MAGTAAARSLRLAAKAVGVACSVIAALVLVHAAFVLFEANRENPLVELTESARDTFAWFTRDLFTKPDPKMAEVINDALAAILYLVVGSSVSKLIAGLGSASKAKA